ncbi:MAG: hypothetical protein H0V17_31750 [Deltaproteobacteria bacterium]|nr:hypothetical protein [Deltaproteobacteria bacterium]
MVKFRETIWFKRGDLVDVEEDEERVELPIEDRYLDTDGVSRLETELFGLHSGQTVPMPRVEVGFASGTIAGDVKSASDLQALVRELKQRNTRIVAMVAAAALVFAVCLFGVL